MVATALRCKIGLRGVQQVQATGRCICCYPVRWIGCDLGQIQHSGGDSSEVQDQLKIVQQVQGAFGAFAAILADGSVVTWGDPDSGGDSSEVQDQLKDRPASSRSFL